MNWFLLEPAADSLLQAALPYLDVFCTLVGIIAALILLVALVYTTNAIRVEYTLEKAKPRVDRVASTLAPPRRLRKATHLRSWLFTR